MSETLNSGHYGFFREILPQDNTTWADLATSPFASWSNWTTWHPDPVDIEVQIDDDLGSIELRQPTLTLGKQGDLGIVLKISDTGTFTGEETTVDLSDGTAKDFVGGQHYRFIITVGTTVDVALPSVAQIDVNYTTDNIVEELKNAVDVPSTPTDSSGYTLVDNNLGLIQNVQATALQGDPYVVADYFETAAQAGESQPYIQQQLGGVAVIESKSPLAVKVVDYNGDPWDGTVDLVLRGVPKIQQTDFGIDSL